MARFVAHKAPDAVRQVITLGSPFAGSPKSSTVWRAYEWLTGDRVDDARIVRQLDEHAAPPPVPSTAIWSRADGIVAWQTCKESAAATTDNIEVRGSHCGLGVNPAVLYAVADRLGAAGRRLGAIQAGRDQGPGLSVGRPCVRGLRSGDGHRAAAAYIAVIVVTRLERRASAR